MDLHQTIQQIALASSIAIIALSMVQQHGTSLMSAFTSSLQENLNQAVQKAQSAQVTLRPAMTVHLDPVQPVVAPLAAPTLVPGSVPVQSGLVAPPPPIQ
jgi:hypothetical protein